MNQETELTTGSNREVILSAAEHWRDRCLARDGSVFTEQALWSLENARELVRHFVDNPDPTEGNFLTKLEGQLRPAPDDAKKLMAELLWVMYLIANGESMKAGTKRSQVRTVWRWSGDAFPDDSDWVGRVLDSGVANPGTAYHTHRWREVAFFVRLIERWKQLPSEEQRDLLTNCWQFGAWMDNQEESRGRLLRHVLMFLLFPEHCVPIVSKTQKREIVRRWYPDLGGKLEDVDFTDRLSVDRALDRVRGHLQAESQERSVDFYHEPWVSQWRKETGRKVDSAFQEKEPARVEKSVADEWAKQTFGDARVWAVAAGEGGRLWPEFEREGHIAMGPDELGDLQEYGSKDDIKRAIAAAKNVENPFNDTLAAWQFVNEMEPGDHIIAKEGRTRILGWGVVTSEYRYEPERQEYRHVRDVNWKCTGRWEIPKARQITPKTLTDFSDYTRWLYMAIHLMQGEEPEADDRETSDGYPPEQATADVFLEPSRFSDIVDLLGRKMNVILEGAPGVGKTFIARRVAYRLLDAEDPGRVRVVQFHQSYAYEDFMQGYRPSEDGGFRLKNGEFYNFCRRAAEDAGRKYVFIIDEINRGNLSRILGEVMLLIEADKRGPEHAIPLTYSSEGDEPFFVPENLYILGTMNTADRSLAMVDYALRRRFGFFTLKPEFQNERFTEYLLTAGVPDDLVSKIDERLTQLNRVIEDDQKNLGPGFVIGHSYFVPTDQDSSLDEDWYKRVIDTEIKPLLTEYWFDQPDKVDRLVRRLLS